MQGKINLEDPVFVPGWKVRITSIKRAGSHIKTVLLNIFLLGGSCLSTEVQTQGDCDQDKIEA